MEQLTIGQLAKRTGLRTSALRYYEAEGLLARAVQHELDHLEGRLLVDRMSPVQRMAQRRRLRDLTTRYQRRIDQAVRVGGTPEGADAGSDAAD